jgi:hypothetical protein
MPISLGSLASSIRKKFADNFAIRSNTTGGLGIASDGSYWNSVNGTIQVASGKATATTTPTFGGAGTTYPMATVNMPTTNNVISITDINPGSSAAIWVQSSSDWWLVDVDETFNTIPGNTVYGATGTNYGATGNFTYASGINYGFVNSNYGPVATGNYFSVTNYGYAYSVYAPYNPLNIWYIYVNNSYTYYGSSYGYGVTGSNYGPKNQNYSTGTNYGGVGTNYGVVSSNATTYAYSQILRISKSVASTVNSSVASIVLTTNSLAKAISMKIFTSGTDITARAYSDNNFVTQVGSDLVYTATGATITTQYGIAISPSAYQQSAIIGSSVNITRQ